MGPEYQFTVAVSDGVATGEIDVDVGFVSFGGQAIVVGDTGCSSLHGAIAHDGADSSLVARRRPDR